ncbi:MAG: DUF805 domain-containing protein [Minisyncoccia bacterium]
MKSVLNKYADFNGRAGRKEYWMFLFFNAFFFILFAVLDQFLGIKVINLFDVLISIYTLLVIIPFVAVAVRRLHDTNRSGWWLLMSFFPLFGHIVLLIFFVIDSTQGQNRYGPNPKEIKSAPAFTV